MGGAVANDTVVFLRSLNFRSVHLHSLHLRSLHSGQVYLYRMTRVVRRIPVWHVPV